MDIPEPQKRRPKRPCTGHNRAKEPCGNSAMKGKTTCANHGGKSLAGIAHPAFKHGKYSKVMPEGLAARFNEALANTSLMSLRSDVALLDVRLEDLIANACTAGISSSRAWTTLKRAQRRYTAARGRSDVKAQQSALYEIFDLIAAGDDNRACWQDITQTQQQKRALIETEAKMMSELSLTLTVAQANVLLGAVTHIVMQGAALVRDEDDRKQLLQYVSHEAAQLMRHEGTE